MNDREATAHSSVARAGMVLGPLVFAAMAAAPPAAGLSSSAWYTLALLALMAIWWMTEAIPIAAAALLPIVVLPLIGAASLAVAAAPYADPVIFLFIGGFILALAIERVGLHRRLALRVAATVGTSPARLVFAFVAGSALLSMWISNTATALMLTPTALGLVDAMAPQATAARRKLSCALVLAVAYGASIGGIGTPVGSPTNLVAMAYLERNGIPIAFATWVLVATPVVISMAVVTAWLLCRQVTGVEADAMAARAALQRALADLGPIRRDERRVLAVFAFTAAAWIARPVLVKFEPLAALSDTTIALVAALALLAMPSADPARQGQRLISWHEAERLPWGVVLLFGGGLSIAAALQANGVTEWLADVLDNFGLVPLTALLLLTATVVLATEVASNTATLTAFLPLVGALSSAAGLPQQHLAFAASIAASMAFMLPIATPPNAIAYASGQVTMTAMVRAGVLLNAAAIAIVVATASILAPQFLR